ncbi:MAG: rod shape-determining protein MreD [Sedimentisphaerales bacterium]|nr:rod shape-determining protein MreD [Sedimentisphaerales bacterium]
MQWLRFAVLVLFGTLLQAGLLDAVTIGGVKPDLLIIFLVFFAIYMQTPDPASSGARRSGGHEAIISSFIIGFAFDLIGTSMGPGTISLGLLGTGLFYLSRFIRLKRMLFQTATIFLTVLAAALLAYPARRIQGQPTYQQFWGPTLGTALYSAIVGPFLFLPIAWWMKIRIHHQGKRY